MFIKKMDKININKIKSKYILKHIFDKIGKKRCLQIVRYNKMIQSKLDVNINNYKEFGQIEIEIIPIETRYKIYYNNFINIINEENKPHFHIFFNDDKKEISKKDKVKKIKVLIDYEVKSFHKLFKNCKNIQKINFIKFNCNNITDMSQMFYGCLSLKELNFSNFNSSKVTNMSWMFSKCSSLKELNLSSFNTNNVTDMSWMFSECSSLEELNISSFNTNNVINMSCMFSGCSSLKGINLSNFNIKLITVIHRMFY